jgi:hypothetical protein
MVSDGPNVDTVAQIEALLEIEAKAHSIELLPWDFLFVNGPERQKFRVVR